MDSVTRPEQARRGVTVAVTGRLARIALAVPGVVLCGTLVVLLCYCRELLRCAAAGERIVVGELGFWFVVGGFLATCTGVAVLQARRLGRLVAGPEHRLRRSLQRLRAGDYDFRVRLRNGDLLAGLAEECDALRAAMQQREAPACRPHEQVPR